MMKNRFVKIMMFVILACLCFALCSCEECGEAYRVNQNLSKQSNYFECERRVTVYNARTDKVIMYIEGYIDISNNDNNELVVTAKVGASTYKKNYVYLNEYTLYVVEDITGTHTDPYHYKIYFDIKMPDVEIK